MGLLQDLLSGTRFDQKATVDRRVQAAGLDAYGRPIAPNVQPSTVAATAQPQLRSNNPDDMIRELRRQRELQARVEAAQALQNSGGQVMPRY